jgi:hypothetical protein
LSSSQNRLVIRIFLILGVEIHGPRKLVDQIHHHPQQMILAGKSHMSRLLISFSQIIERVPKVRFLKM